MEPRNQDTVSKATTRKMRRAVEGEKHMVNGVDTAALQDTIAAIQADPSKAKCMFFSTTRWQQGTVAETEISRYRLGGEDIPQRYTMKTDEPAALLGTDTAPNPQMYLYAALASCVLNTFIVSAAVRGVRIDSLEVDIEGELDLRGFLGIDESVNPGYDRLTLTCRVSGSGTRQQLEECLEAGTRFSPNFQSIRRPVHVTYRLEMR